ncbi:CopG family transcriptional regulator [Mesorhizobium sp. B2-4-8]|uniref:ribbon-helix-helix domain-containing protein n=1 Tax=Mesorhizobium sp. B2-4-8 TaxID=2589941 RepID=UPI001128FB0B|nr:CopG family transcriptional regulator [Mesorhizobium sp. B2-4-8]TPL35579.1 CopG family transcriptional regulator [Mesorhizobium sp. B2-4-8]
MGKDGRDAERVTTTLTKRQKAELDRLAKAQGVKVAWLIRRAVERYLDDAAGGPMLPLELGGGEDVKR